MTIPRIIIRDLGDHADKKELVRIYSRFDSFRNVWVANNPPGFAYVFFDGMKDALKAVASTNGRTLCGGRVRVELTPIDEEEDNRRRLATAKNRSQQRNLPRAVSPSYHDKRFHHIQDPLPTSPVMHHRRNSSSFSSSSSRRQSTSHYFDEPIDVSPVRQERVQRRPKDYVERRKKGRDDANHERRFSGDSSRPNRMYVLNTTNDLYTDGRREKSRYANEQYMSPASSPELQTTSYSHSQDYFQSQKMGRDTFDKYSRNTLPKHRKSSSSGSVLRIDDDLRHQSSQSWRRSNESRMDQSNYYTESPPPLSPSPPPPPMNEHSRSTRRDKEPSHRYQSRKAKAWEDSSSNLDVVYDARHRPDNVTYSYVSARSSSPSPPPPSLLLRQRHKHSESSHSSRPHDYSRKVRERSSSGHQSRSRREDTSSHGSIRRHRSRSPLYLKKQNDFSAASPTQEYEYLQREIPDHYQHKSLAIDSPPQLKNHQYYEQIEESNDGGFFSEVGYHSAQQSPQEFVRNPQNVVEYVEDRDPPHQVVYTVENNSVEYHGLQVDTTPTYEGEVIEQYLQIDAVKGGSTEEYCTEQSPYQQEREVMFSGQAKNDREVVHGRKHEKEREVVHSRKHEREREVVHGRKQEKEREVVHGRKHEREREVIHGRKRDREVNLKRSPERNRSRRSSKS